MPAPPGFEQGKDGTLTTVTVFTKMCNQEQQLIAGFM
jgi:hypothetical protein